MIIDSISPIILTSFLLGSLVRPKLLKSVHFEPKSKVFFARDYRDNTMIGPGNELPGSNAIPKEVC